VGFSPGDFVVRDSRERAPAMHDDSFPGWRPEKSIQVVERDGQTRVLLKGQPYMSWRSGDEESLRLAIVQLHECGLGTQEELAEAFGRHVNSVQRYLTGFADEGLRGLLAERRGPKGGWKITPEVRGHIFAGRFAGREVEPGSDSTTTGARLAPSGERSEHPAGAGGQWAE